MGIPGIALANHTFGDCAKWHPHTHALVADGLFTETAALSVTGLPPPLHHVRAIA